MDKDSKINNEAITTEILNYDNNEDIDKIFDFLNGLDSSVPQQYPLIKYLYPKNDQKFYYLYSKQSSKVVGTLSFVIFVNETGNIAQSNPMLGYGGILSDENNKEDIFISLVNKMMQIAKQNNCISITIGTPILDKNLETYKKIFKPDFIKENFFQYSTLDTLPINKLNSKRRSSIKSEIAKSIKANVKVIKDDHRLFDEWYKIYTDRFRDINANALPYDFLKNAYIYFNEKNMADIYYVILNNELIGGTLVIYNKNVMDYFSTGFKTKYMKLNSGQYLLNQIHEDAFKQNIKIFNWESSPSRNGGVYEFKKRWGAFEDNHFYLTKITGDIEKLKSIDIEIIKNNYKGYYLMPYEVLK